MWRGRVSAAVVILSVLLSTLAFCPGTVAATSGPGGPSAVGPAGVAGLAGSGTPDDPYRITSAAELQSMRDDLDAHYVLVADLDASGTAAWNDGAGFAPVGDSAGPFNGTFDGDGHTISGLTVDRPGTEEVGLFGRTGDGAVVTGVGLDGATVTGGFDVGGLVGLNDGGAVTDSSVTGTVNGTDAVGGLVGLNDEGTVVDSTVAGDVTGEGQVGGLVGLNFRGTVERSEVTGTVEGVFWVGGLAGQNLGTVSDSTARGSVTGVDSVGGLVGHNSRGTVTASLARGSVDADTFVGGLVGSNVGGTVGRSAATGSVTGVTLVGGLVGQSFEGGTVTDSFAAGAVTGEREVGGLLGASEHRVVESYWDTEATGRATSDGGRGLATAEMTGLAARANMAGFDVPGAWLLTETYPTLPREGSGPFFTVDAASPGGAATEGDAVRVDATVTNYGRPGTRTVALYDTGFGDTLRDERAVGLDTGESETVTLSWRTRRGDNGTGSLTVASGNDSDSVTATIAASPADGGNGSDDGGSSSGGGGLPGAEPPGGVELTGATLETRTLTAGEEALVEVALANFDPASGRVTLALTADDATVTERTVSVAASTERTVSIAYRFEAAGRYALAVNGIPAGSITVEDPTAATATPATTATPPPTRTGEPTAAAPPGNADPSTETPTETARPSSPTAGTPAAGPGFTVLPALLALGVGTLLGRRPD